MNAPRPFTADALFLELATVEPSNRAAVLDQRCAGDPALRAEVEALLADLDVPDAFLDPAQLPAMDLHALDGPLKPGARLGGYLVLQAIGSGGMGVVYLAQQDRPQRTVALKVLRRGAHHPDMLRRFELEAEMLGKLQHAAIAQIYAFHPGDRLTPASIAMELVNGPRITEYVDSHALDIRARVLLLARVCDGVQHAHQRGIIHRDLKPANILVDEHGQPKILDFGVARAAGADFHLTTVKTREGELVGTLAYMSPEQLSGSVDAIDARSDVYALGVLLYRLLSGRLPLDISGLPFAAALRRLLDDKPVRLGLIDRDLRGDLEMIVARAMAAQPDRRYQSAAELASELRAWHAGLPIAPAADERWRAITGQMRRYRRALSIAAIVGVALISVAAYALIERARANANAARLEEQLSISRIERGRLLAETGGLSEAEAALWPEFFRRPTGLARWALREVYAQQPVLWTAEAHRGAVRAIAFTPDERGVITSGDDRRLLWLDSATGTIRHEVDAHRAAVWHIVVSRARNVVVSASLDGRVRVWNADTLAPIADGPQHAGSVRALAIDHAGLTVASGSDDGVLHLWSLDRPSVVREVKVIDGLLSGLAFSPDGTRIAVGLPTGELRLLDAQRLTRIRDLVGHTRGLGRVSFSPDGRWVASGGVDRTARVWDASTGEPITVLRSNNGTARNVVFSAGGAMLTVPGWWRLERWDTRTWLRLAPDLGRGEPFFDAAYTREGSRLVTAGEYSTVRMWDVSPAQWRSSWPDAASPRPRLVEGAPDGTLTRHAMAAAHEIRVNAGRGEPVGTAVAPHAGAVFVSSRDQTIARRRLTDLGESWAVPTTFQAFELSVSPDERTLAAGLFTGGIELRDAANGALRAVLPAHVRQVSSLAFSADGRVLVSAGLDGAVQAWDVESASKLAVVARRDVGATRVSFTRDPSHLAVSWEDGRIQEIDLNGFDRYLQGNEAYQRARRR